MGKPKILVVDDSRANVLILNEVLQDSYSVMAATSGLEALELVHDNESPDIILLDVVMPEMDGYETCRHLKADEKTAKIPVLFVTDKDEVEDEAKGLDLGAVDYIIKPISPPILLARVRNHLDLKRHQNKLEDLVIKRTMQLKEGYVDTILRLTLASEFKDEDTGKHVKRISFYTKTLAERMGFEPTYCEQIYFASLMHDIGKVAIPDAILLKEGPLDEQEWKIMKTHAEVGAKILGDSKSPYLQMAEEIARYHHERWDGGGYPYGIKGEAIPMTARIMNIADQYDALRSQRPYKPAFDHKKAVSIITQGDGRTLPEHFDPEVLSAFVRLTDTFADIFETHKDK
ncbi:putative two-component system response regulator [Desulfuromusa kysingii]|uniref:Putative two-component system response regulator n=1 Tax=Desulfuromusa kysingii TaxID=37625 RepID=A0A1H3VZI1_9BACT|nr:HD domain-containing phosphohydrolase [Desulfuromusa kysingii]SDZ80091.1 putative two-component system response regulator [Desulfuromusa kysingii]